MSPSHGSFAAGEPSQGQSPDRPWLARYPAGVPADIDPSTLPTLAALFEDSVARFADRPALRSFGVTLTYAEFGRQVRSITSELQRMGMNKGDRLAIMMPNVMAYPAILFGALCGGFTVVNINPLYSPRELAHQLNDSGARMIFILDMFAHTLDKALMDLTALERAVIVRPGDLLGAKGIAVNFASRWLKKTVKPYSLPMTHRFTSLVDWGARRDPDPVQVSPEDVAFLQYTGGTTGVSRGAVLTHANVAANVLQAEAWLRPSLAGNLQHVMYTALPLYHIFALTVCCLFMFRIGAMQVLVANPRDVGELVDTMKSTPPTILVFVNTLFGALARHPRIGDADFSKLSLCIAGGMAMQESVARAWKKVSGKPVVEGYGLSETSPLVSVNRLDIEEFTGTVGYPSPSTYIRIVDDNGSPVPPGEPGELCVKGPQVMRGYWNAPEQNERSITPDGYFRTGDIATLDSDGALRIVDRLKDMIIVSGLKVFPNEVEDALAAHPGVREVAVIGEPHDRLGEQVAAFIARADEALTEDDVRAFARDRLAAFKVPHRIQFVDELPKSTVGKILRRELRAPASKDA